MSRLLLLDLDDTLLLNSMDQFIPAYLQKLGAALNGHVDPGAMTAALLSATRKMMANNDPTQTLEAVFNAHFYPAIGLQPEAVRPALERFYAEDFPRLRALTQPRPGAAELVQTALARGWQVAVATNPLFPHTAIAQRLEWAGLPASATAFAWVPGFESFHFSKPNPAYFTEMLAVLGWPDGPVVMVGDDFEMDIRPSQTLGLPAFWTPPDPASASPAFVQAARQMGALQDLLPWLDRSAPEDLTPTFTTKEALLAALRGIAAALPTLAHTLPPANWNTRPNREDWSLTENLCHLRDVEIQVNRPRIERILAENNPFIIGMDTDMWIETRGYQAESGSAALQTLVAARLETLELLASLSPEAWQRPARHSIFGPTHLQELVGFMLAHDRIHLKALKTLAA